MFLRSSGCFKDFSVFAAFLILYSSFLQSGYGQQRQEASGGRVAQVPQSAKRAVASPAGAANAGATFRTAPTSVQPGSVKQTLAAVPPRFSRRWPQYPQAAALPPAAIGANAGVGPRPDPNYSAAGFRLHPMQPDTKVVSLAKPAPRPAKAIGRALRPLQLNGPDDATDPYIVSQAQALNNNPTQIFAFVRDQVGYEAYTGSLRGARGTLWSNAGKCAGSRESAGGAAEGRRFTAQYVQGTLSKARRRR